MEINAKNIPFFNKSNLLIIAISSGEGLDDNLDVDHPQHVLLHLHHHSPTTSLMPHKYLGATRK